MSELQSAPIAKKRSDYCPPHFLIPQVDMTFWLHSTATKVVTKSVVERSGSHTHPLVLSGEKLQLEQVLVNGQPWQAVVNDQGELVIETNESRFELEITTVIDPANNTSLEGLYLSNGTYCTQCEAEGFRKITWFLDRPDILSSYRVTIHGNEADLPYMLSNGNKVATGTNGDGTHWITWQDPHKKPAYLFALVAGQFEVVDDTFQTLSGRDVSLQLFVEKGNEHRGQHALDSLQRAMQWDEQVFGLEYDLDIYMIVAVDFFNMGAMENKGLNVFNSKCVLADPKSATDEDFFNVESIIAHEYFHNWTGNRVTCRDWFQLSLKEGLTVFRDQQFSSDMASPVINRINQVKVIKERQFAEDASPMSHPIRPDEVIEMNNFYTVTVYDKGAEVIRMIHTLLGKVGFRKGMDLYFERHDGQAVTCDDFVMAMQDANGVDLSLFKRWYGQSGTPEVSVGESYDSQTQEFTLTLTQHTPATADQAEKQHLHIPVDVMLLNEAGQPFDLDGNGEKSLVLDFTASKQNFTFKDITCKPVMDIFRNFSSPVKIHFQQELAETRQLLLYAKDDYSRWQAGQQLFNDAIFAGLNFQGDIPASKLAELTPVIAEILQNKPSDSALLSEILSVPTFDSLAQMSDVVNVDYLVKAINCLERFIGTTFQEQFQRIYQQTALFKYDYQQQQVASRRLRNTCLYYLAQSTDNKQLLLNQYHQADNMTDTLGALKAAQRFDLDTFERLMNHFEKQWHSDVLVLDKWFALHAGLAAEDILTRLSLLQSHPRYDMNNPNRVRAVTGTFAFYNTEGFHKADGSGYEFVADAIIQLNKINPQVASRIITPFNQWQRFVGDRKDKMQSELLRIANEPSLSSDLYEKVTKALTL